MVKLWWKGISEKKNNEWKNKYYIILFEYIYSIYPYSIFIDTELMKFKANIWSILREIATHFHSIFH